MITSTEKLQSHWLPHSFPGFSQWFNRDEISTQDISATATPGTDSGFSAQASFGRRSRRFAVGHAHPKIS